MFRNRGDVNVRGRESASGCAHERGCGRGNDRVHDYLHGRDHAHESVNPGVGVGGCERNMSQYAIVLWYIVRLGVLVHKQQAETLRYTR